MAKNKIYPFSLVFLSLLSTFSLAQENNPGIVFTKTDRVLILAPHPDDESIGTAGVIQKSLKAQAKVKVVCYTNGDHNELSFIVYEKRITFKQREFIHMGELRKKETIKAMKSLGLEKTNLSFLGYPDFGTMEILTKYWDDTSPFKDLLTRISRVPYADSLSPNAPYVGESILRDMKEILLDFKPTKIFVSHPVDTNRDHRSLYLFLRIALWDLEGQIKKPQIFPYLIHVVGWPKPRGFHPDLEVDPPKQLENKSISWLKLELSEDELKAKHEAISVYKSQIKCDPPYLFTFARRNELFGDYPAINLKEQDASGIEWQDVEIPAETEEKGKRKIYISDLAYAREGRNLLVRITLKRRITEYLGLSIFLIGYSKNQEFATMPKIKFSLGLGGVHLKNKKQSIPIKDIKVEHKDKTFLIKFPLSILGNPNYILSCARTNTKDLPYDETAWRIIELD